MAYNWYWKIITLLNYSHQIITPFAMCYQNLNTMILWIIMFKSFWWPKVGKNTPICVAMASKTVGWDVIIDMNSTSVWLREYMSLKLFRTADLILHGKHEVYAVFRQFPWSHLDRMPSRKSHVTWFPRNGVARGYHAEVTGSTWQLRGL